MGLVIFYETLLVILVSVLTAAVCLSSYLVTRRRTMLFACAAFLFYFLDVASILQDDYAARALGPDQSNINVSKGGSRAWAFTSSAAMGMGLLCVGSCSRPP